MTDHDLRPPQQRERGGAAWRSTTRTWVLGLVAIAVVAALGWYGRGYWDPQAQEVAGNKPKPSEVSAGAAAQAGGTAEPGALLPLERVPSAEVQSSAQASATNTAQQAASEQAVPELDAAQASQVKNLPNLDELAKQWLGNTALQFLVTPNLAHHIVATVDNLPRSHAAPRLWPINPVGARMVVAENAQGIFIAPANSTRYDAVVNFVTATDPAQITQWYRQAYPVLQQRYEDLGYPGKSFNDRLLEVIDHLLQTPQVAEPIALRLVQVQTEGERLPQQPWLRYEFADAQLQSLSAGQKILLRLGSEHRQRVAAYLQALRTQLAQ